MDPLSVLKTMWRYKWVSVPMVLVTVLACAYGLLWAPGTYESKATFALAMPKVPTDLEIEADPDLADVNQDNPYLRWRDTSLLAQVVIARVHSVEVADRLEAEGLDADYDLVPPDGTGSGMMNLTVTAESPETASMAAVILSEEFDRIMNDVQKINGADDSYLIESIPVSGPTPPEEVFSSRLRSTAVLGAGGVVLLLGAVSLAQSIDRVRRRSQPSKGTQRGDARSAAHAGTLDNNGTPSSQGSVTAKQPLPIHGPADFEVGADGDGRGVRATDVNRASVGANADAAPLVGADQGAQDARRVHASANR
ncbi:hypothetical protein [Microbacterium sp. A93]|uniref:hypothetical protein n=1 Tax=Microbacterium sp. A93 TaxID=3450716 RepID=UPI003F41F657